MKGKEERQEEGERKDGRHTHTHTYIYIHTQRHTYLELPLHVLLLLQVVLKRGRKHVRKDLEGKRQQQLHERHNHKKRKGDKAEEVSGGPCELPPLAS